MQRERNMEGSVKNCSALHIHWKERMKNDFLIISLSVILSFFKRHTKYWWFLSLSPSLQVPFMKPLQERYENKWKGERKTITLMGKQIERNHKERECGRQGQGQDSQYRMLVNNRVRYLRVIWAEESYRKIFNIAMSCYRQLSQIRESDKKDERLDGSRGKSTKRERSKR